MSTSIQEQSLPAERPIGKSEQFVLLLSTTALLMVFYWFSIVALLLIGGILLLEVVAAVCLARFAASFFLRKPIRWIWQLGRELASSLKLSVGGDEGISLSSKDAPGLFAMVENISSKVGVAPPDEIVLYPDDNAGISCLSRKGRVVLRLGYDLMAVVTKAEMESVIAHEMAHVKCKNRGWAAFIDRGLVRVRNFAGTLTEAQKRLDSHKQTSYIVDTLHFLADELGQAMCRLQARCSRQQEFEADLLAAQLCGPQVMGCTLMKLDIMTVLGRNIPLRDRRIRVGREEDYAGWLRSQLKPADDEAFERLKRHVLDPKWQTLFDTHPSLSDRLSAIGYTDSAVAYPDESAVELLSDATGAIEKLHADLHSRQLAWEMEDSELAREEKVKRIGNKNVTAWRFACGFLIAIGVSGLLCVVWAAVNATDSSEMTSTLGFVPLTCAVIMLGVVAYIHYRRERLQLPVPSLGEWMDALSKRDSEARELEWYDELRGELTAQLPSSLRGKRALAAYWGDLGYQALEECDYSRAMVAADQCLKYDNKSSEGLLASGISRAYFRQSGYAAPLDKAISIYGGTASVVWALGWIGMLWNNWEYSQGYLLEAERQLEGSPGVSAVLGLCQWEIGKQSEAISHLQRARDLDGEDARVRKFLSRFLLISGRAAEALHELEELERMETDARFLAIHYVWAQALLGRAERAEERAQLFLEKYPGGDSLINIAVAFSDAGLRSHSLEYYRRVLDYGFYPEALLALAEDELESKNMLEARRLALLAMDQTKEVGEGGDSAAKILPNACYTLTAASGDYVECQAWVVSHRPPVIVENVPELEMLIYAPSKEQAHCIASEILAAMYPGHALSEKDVRWAEASKDDMPTVPGIPGVHGVRRGAGDPETASKGAE